MFLRRDKKPASGAISRPTNTQNTQGKFLINLGSQNTVKALAGFDDDVEIEQNTKTTNSNSKPVVTTNIFG